MAKRIVHECDLSKLEYDPDETVKITIKHKSKPGRTYEISANTADKLEIQLSPAGDTLSTDWSFTATDNISQPAGDEPFEVLTPSQRRQELNEVSDDDVLARKIKTEHKEVIEEEKEKPKKTSGSQQVIVNREILGGDPECSHARRSRPQMTMVEGHRYAYTNCIDCGAEIPIKRQTERAAIANTKAPAGSRVRN